MTFCERTSRKCSWAGGHSVGKLTGYAAIRAMCSAGGLNMIFILFIDAVSADKGASVLQQ